MSDNAFGGELFSPPADPPKAFARRTDPETSHAAAKSVESEATRLENIVYEATKKRGDLGLTWDEAALETGLPPASVSPRWKPLRAKGMIKAKTDQFGNTVKRAGASGRGQIVWVAV